MVEERLRARGDWLGASCIARYRDHGFVFAAALQDDTLVLSGIGGKVEPGETFRDAALREYTEETGARPEALVEVDRPRRVPAEANDVPVPPGAAALVAEPIPGHRPGAHLYIAVFLGAISTAPRTLEKVRHFAVVPPAAFSTFGVHGRFDLTELAVVEDGIVRPAAQALASRVRAVQAVHTARAVLGSPGLLAEWWDSSTQPRV